MGVLNVQRCKTPFKMRTFFVEYLDILFNKILSTTLLFSIGERTLELHRNTYMAFSTNTNVLFLSKVNCRNNNQVPCWGRRSRPTYLFPFSFSNSRIK